MPRLRGGRPAGVGRSGRVCPQPFKAPGSLDCFVVIPTLPLDRLVTLDQLGPERGNLSRVSQVIELCGPVHVAASVVVDRW